MTDKHEVYNHIAGVIANLFQVDIKDVTPDANLYEDLDIDSIDAVDLVVELKKWTGKKIQPENFKSVKTVQDVVDAVIRLLNE